MDHIRSTDPKCLCLSLVCVVRCAGRGVGEGEIVICNFYLWEQTQTFYLKIMDSAVYELLAPANVRRLERVPQSMFMSKNKKKIMYSPVNTSLLYKNGFKGVKII